MDTEAKNMRAPEHLEGTDFECDNLDDMGMGEDFDAIHAEEDDDKDLNERHLENRIGKSMDDDEDDFDKSEGDEDEDEDDDDDDDSLKKQVAKGGLTVASLNKSIANLARYAEQADPEARKKSIMQRAMLGKSLSKSERAELMEHLNGDEPRSERRQLTKGLANNTQIQQSVDVSEYLAGQHTELVKALNDVERRMTAMAAQNTEFQLLLAKAVAQTGQGVMRLNKSIAVADAAPVRGPKSMGVSGRSRPLQKSGMSEGMALTKGQASEALDALLVKSRTSGRYGRSESGADLLKASTHFESSGGQLLPEVQGDIRRYIRENR